MRETVVCGVRAGEDVETITNSLRRIGPGETTRMMTDIKDVKKLAMREPRLALQRVGKELPAELAAWCKARN